MNTSPYIILLKGKLCLIELPEKPKQWDYESGGDPPMTPAYVDPSYYDALQSYESARSAAIEKRIEIENPGLFEVIHLPLGVTFHQFFNNFPDGVQWHGIYRTIFVNSDDHLAGAQKKVAQLIDREPILDAIHSDTDVSIKKPSSFWNISWNRK